MEEINSESEIQTCKPLDVHVTDRESQLQVMSEYSTSGHIIGSFTEQYLQTHPHFLQIQQSQLLHQQENNSQEDVQKQTEEQHFTKQQLPYTSLQQNEERRQEECQTQLQTLREYKQPDIEGLKQGNYNLHLTSKSVLQQQKVFHKYSEKEKNEEVGGGKFNSVVEDLRKYELKDLIFSPESLSVKNRTLARETCVPYSCPPQNQSNVSVQCQSLGKTSLPQIDSQVPISVTEHLKTISGNLSAHLVTLDGKYFQTSTKHYDENREMYENETVSFKSRMMEDEYLHSSENNAEVKRASEDSPELTKLETSKSFFIQKSIEQNPSLATKGNKEGSLSSTECFKTGISKPSDVIDEYADDGDQSANDVEDRNAIENSEIDDNYICLCHDDFIRYAKYRVKKYICGSCFSSFISVCHLHKHLEKHGSGGSYHFDHVSQTAYPKYDTFCSFTQTDIDYSEGRDEFILSEGENNVTEAKNVERNETLPLLEVQVKDFNESKLTEQKAQPNRKFRKRKQDNPKPTKPRLVNTRKNEKSRTVRRKQKEPDYYEDYESDISEPHTVGLSESKENDQVNAENVDSDTIDLKLEFTSDESEEHKVTKALRKRGRPRKSEINIEKNATKKKKIVKHDVKVSDKQVREESKRSFDKKEFLSEETSENIGDDEVQIKRKAEKNVTKYQMCDICGLPVPKYNYLYHMRRHTGEKPFVCDKCGKTFAHRRFLVKHMLIHNEDKPWKCHLCTAQFCQKSEYKMHINAHEGKRPYECKVCEMKFLSKSMLNTHQANVHMGITRFECEVCHRRFFKRSSLNVHQATHFEATLKCNFCDRMFKDRAGLKRHERIHTGEKRFRCHICNHEFIQSTPYWVHMEKRHQMKRETVKTILKDIRENNKRIGVRTEINVLPNDVGQLLKSQEENSNSCGENMKNVTRKDFEIVAEDRQGLNTGSCSGADTLQPVSVIEENINGEMLGAKQIFTGIKVPNLPQSMTSNLYRSEDSRVSAASQHYEYAIPDCTTSGIPSSNIETGTTTVHESVMTSSQSLALPGKLPVPASLGTLGVSMGSVYHGFIGINRLQQTLDYSSSLPNTGTYTDISNDRVNNQHQ